MAVIENVDQVNTHALAGLLAEIIKETENKPFVSDPLAYIARELTKFGVHYPGIYEEADEDADLLPEPPAPSDPASLAALVPRPAPGTRPTVHGVPLTADPDEQSKSHLYAARKHLQEQVRDRESAKSNTVVINLTPDTYGAVLRNTEALKEDAA